MDYIDKLEGGQPISKVFPSCRKTTYRNLYIVSSKGKEALFHYSDENKVLLSAWYDHIDEFDNFIYTKVYFKDKYLVTGHLPTRAIEGAKPDEIYIANNHIAIDCASGYGGKVGCIRLDDFNCFYSKQECDDADME